MHTLTAPAFPFTCVPDWYWDLWFLTAVKRRKWSYFQCLLASIQTLITLGSTVFKWFWLRLFASIRYDSPRIFEMFVAGTEISVATFLLMEHGAAYRNFFLVLALRAPIEVWGCTAIVLGVVHVISLMYEEWEWRAYALALSFLGWWIFGGVFARWGFGFVESIARPIWIFCLLSIACLMWQHSHGKGENDGRLE